MLPNWPGAAAVYATARRVLERMAQCGHVQRKKIGRRWLCEVSDDMRALIDGLNRGDEETT